MKNFIFLLGIFMCSWAHASEWKSITIPEARCADGKPYNVLYQEKNPNKLLVEFMGGGVCWNRKSCFKPTALFPWLHPYPTINSYSVFTSNTSSINPFTNHSKLYFPYCTADVHAGNHIAHYEDKTVYHYGKKNILLALQYLRENHLVDFKTVDDLVLYGASAGAIASLLHGKTIEAYIQPQAQKTMIADSVGLHYGERFWEKFSPEMRNDFIDSFRNVNLTVDLHDGLVAKKMAPVFDLYSNWKIGFLLGLQDYVMSEIFGDLSPSEEKKLILSNEGLPAIAQNYPNVKIWLKNTYMHTFLLSRPSAELRSQNGQSAIEFARQIYFNE